jgi:hypothetical protein
MDTSPLRRLRQHSRIITKRPGIDLNSPAPPLPPPPAKIKKSDIRPPDATAPAMDQFSETVKRSASYLLKTVGLDKPELRPALNRVFSRFYRSFDQWMATTGHTSQRKLNEPAPSISHLEGLLSESTELLSSLRSEVRIWAHANAEVREIVPCENVETFEEEDSVIDTDCGIEALMEEVATRIQRRRMELRRLEELNIRLFNEFQATLKIDFLAQSEVCDSLR